MTSYKLLRGGSWYFTPRSCRSASRFRFLPVDALFIVGFRVVCPTLIQSIQSSSSMDPIYSFEIRNGDFNRTEINFFRDTLPNSGSDMLAAIAIHTSWKGREDGAVYRAVVPADVSHAIYRELNELNHGLRPDAETAIRQWIKEFESDLKLASLFSGKSQNLNWTKIRTGTIVK